MVPRTFNSSFNLIWRGLYAMNCYLQPGLDSLMGPGTMSHLKLLLSCEVFRADKGRIGAAFEAASTYDSMEPRDRKSVV